MASKAIRVSSGEMEILAMLWQCGPMPLRQAHEAFGKFGKPIAYPTMQTRLNRMVSKHLLRRQDEHPSVYHTAVTRDQVTLGHLRQIVDKISQGDVVPLVARLLSEQTLTPDQVACLQELLTAAQQRSQTKSGKRRGS